MEEFIIELDDETADWLDCIAAAEKKSASAMIEEMIRQQFERNRKLSGKKPPPGLPP
ncbi:MAG TPA: ribbon-helix-helix protein, CopG family [Steroidobacteraceae bacterium]|jgi:predicted transcriptional regulator|nr:ribbon-helix-helix protein, CopG family [Steroidobacteraceae bacterium]